VFLNTAASTSCHSSAFLGSTRIFVTHGEAMKPIVQRYNLRMRWRLKWSTE
jgi:hypothetical protein